MEQPRHSSLDPLDPRLLHTSQLDTPAIISTSVDVKLLYACPIGCFGIPVGAQIS